MVDYHIHTTFSDGELDYRAVIDLAGIKGLKAIAITDHYDKMDNQIKNQAVSDQMLEMQFNKIRDYAENKSLKVFCGVETGADFEGQSNLSKDAQNMCDIIITSPHYVEYDGQITEEDYFDPCYWNKYKEKLLNMAASGKGDVLGHPEGYLPIGIFGTGKTTYESRKRLCREISKRFFDSDFIDELGNQLLKSEMAYELHCATNTPRETVIKQLADKGVTFSVGSDAHAGNRLGKTEWGYKMIRKYSLKIFNPSDAAGRK